MHYFFKKISLFFFISTINKSFAQLYLMPEKINLYNPKFVEAYPGSNNYYFVKIEFKNDKKFFKSSGTSQKIDGFGSKTNDILVNKSNGTMSTLEEAKSGVNLTNNASLVLFPIIKNSTYASLESKLVRIPWQSASYEPKFLYNYQKLETKPLAPSYWNIVPLDFFISFDNKSYTNKISLATDIPCPSGASTNIFITKAAYDGKTNPTTACTNEAKENNLSGNFFALNATSSQAPSGWEGLLKGKVSSYLCDSQIDNLSGETNKNLIILWVNGVRVSSNGVSSNKTITNYIFARPFTKDVSGSEISGMGNAEDTFWISASKSVSNCTNWTSNSKAQKGSYGVLNFNLQKNTNKFFPIVPESSNTYALTGGCDVRRRIVCVEKK